VKKTIYKYPIQLHSAQHVTLPRGARVLTVNVQLGQLVIWAEVEVDNDGEPTEVEQRKLYVFGTGHTMLHEENEALRYIGTAFQGPYVWHVYEVQ
jgi:hypothetical protein